LCHLGLFDEEKGGSLRLLQKFATMEKTQFGKDVKTTRSDNGLEFLSGPMKQFYSKKGILHETSCIDSPQ